MGKLLNLNINKLVCIKNIIIQTLKYVFAYYIIIATKSLYDLVKLLQCPASAYFFHMKKKISGNLSWV